MREGSSGRQSYVAPLQGWAEHVVCSDRCLVWRRRLALRLLLAALHAGERHASKARGRLCTRPVLRNAKVRLSERCTTDLLSERLVLSVTHLFTRDTLVQHLDALPEATRGRHNISGLKVDANMRPAKARVYVQ